MFNLARFQSYFHLMRLQKPIGILLLLWPTLWAVWLAGAGRPSFGIVLIFVTGVILMRSAGCIINDIADRHFDGYVERTKDRPLVTQQISLTAALVLFAILCLCALILVMQLNHLTIVLAFLGAGLTVIYPFLKRYTHLPQLGLGLAFAWGVPMAFAAQLETIPPRAWWLFLAAAVWPVIYDTIYAMVDMRDDLKIGVKSTAILFGKNTLLILILLQLLFLLILMKVGFLFGLNSLFFFSLLIALGLFGYQIKLIKQHQSQLYFKAFLNNHWVGFTVFLGIVLSYSL